MAQVTVNTSAYTVKSVDRGFLYYDANNAGSVTSSSHTNITNATPTGAANEQFAFLRTDNTIANQYYMYSIAAEQFVTYTGNNGVKLELTDEPACTWVLEASGTYYGIKVPRTDQTYINITNWQAVNGCKVFATGLDEGNKMTLAEVATGLDLSAAIAKIEVFEQPLINARTAFKTAYEEAGEVIANAEISFVETEVALQTSDQNNPNYLMCNHPETSEGNIAYLVDNSTSTGFFHSQWSNPVPAAPHYLLIDLGEENEIAEFAFGYHTRVFDGVNDFPDGIKVLGSNDNNEFTEIYNVTSNLPQASNRSWKSVVISSGTAYRYLRFEVTAERIYWHMSEFDLYKNESRVASKYAAVKDYVIALNTLYDTHAGYANYNTDELNAAAEAINAAVASVKAGIVDIPVTPDAFYETLAKPTYAGGGNTTKVAMVEFDGVNLTDFTFTSGQTNRVNTVPTVEAGKTYELNLTYELHWGDIAIFQIDNEGGKEKKYGYYHCTWNTTTDPDETLKNSSGELMCEELGISSFDDLELEGDYLTVPYKITIDENLKPGDVVVVRMMTAENNAAYNATNIREGGCLDLVLQVAHPLTVTAAGYATLYLGFDAAIPTIPTIDDEDNGVYIVKEDGINENYIHLEPVTGVLPANTGVIVKANPGTYWFAYSAETKADVSANLLRGSVSDEYVQGAAYVLSAPDGAESVGLYPADLNKNATGGEGTTHFLNNANKAYLPNSTDSNVASYSFRFGEGTTGIEKVEIRNEKSEIYDLTGRRIEAITAPGIYVVNGKKVLVK